MSRPLLILHLSDLHFGLHSRFAGEDMESLAQRFHQAIDDARRELDWKERVGLCIVTGDVAEAARKKEYRDARVFFEALVGNLGLERPRFVFAPGNHDVSWAITQKIEIDQRDEDFDTTELERRIEEEKLKRFDDFLESFYGRERKSLPHVEALGHGAYVHRFPEEQLAVAALNSCERESHRRQGGVLGTDQAQALMRAWRQDEVRRWIKLIAIHHNPVATVPANVWPAVRKLEAEDKAGGSKALEEWLGHFVADIAGFEGHEHLRSVAQDCQVQLVLHGHHHAHARLEWPWEKGERAGRTPVLSAGSLGLRPDKLPEDQPNMLHLLRLDPARRELRSVLRTYEPRARAEGSVQPGHFAVDPANPKGSTLELVLPDGLEAESARPPEEPAARDTEEIRGFLEEYRTQLGRRHDRWDLRGVGAVQPGGAGKPVEATLDDMYQPLRLAKGHDPEKLDAGRVLDPGELLSRKKPLVIRGAAGTGKTTWMRWTFRRLVRDGRALPFLIELRKLAHVWSDRQIKGEERTIDGYLRTYVSESGAGGWQEALPRILRAKEGPRPVLLVDGWDELGELGDELRDKLNGFLAAHPRVQAVVSSRPYGQSQPTHGDGFEILDLQPLADEEIARFAEQFHRRVYGEDEVAARESTRRIQQALKASPEALSLARTPLLLTMMLLISRDRQLPDKRHLLYHECLRNLLSARPDEKVQEGALLLRHQWRPDDGEERMRVVAAMAARMQMGTKKGRSGLIVHRWEKLEPLLPESWKREEKQGFLAWLVGAAGVMVDRTDGTFSFTHLSFQEYLTAHHLAAINEGTEARLELCRERSGDQTWWETLRLWAAIVWDRNPEHLCPVLLQLIEDEKPARYWLTGAILADGPGGDVFGAWREGLGRRFHVLDLAEADTAARAWAGSRQDARREALGETWTRFACSREWTWLQAAMAAPWAEMARLTVATRSHTTFDELVRHAGAGKGMARGRVLWGVRHGWPFSPEELILLRLVPTPRAVAAARLQTIVSCGGTREQLRTAARRLFVPTQEEDAARDLARYLARDLARDWARDWARYWARYLARDLARDWAQDWARYWARYWARDWARYWARYWARDLARDWGFDALPAWLDDYATVELASPGRAGTRVFVAHEMEAQTPHARLLKLACQDSLEPATNATSLQEALASYPADADPLWPALARHLVRHSTEEDQALLVDLIKHPEKVEPPLSWGLKYYVRGDLVLEDDSELTLDALCEEIGLEPLPYLEDMLPELEVDWDAGEK